MNKNEILDKLFVAYDSIGEGQGIPKGLLSLIMDLAEEMDRMEECRKRDEGHMIPDFVRR